MASELQTEKEAMNIISEKNSILERQNNKLYEHLLNTTNKLQLATNTLTQMQQQMNPFTPYSPQSQGSNRQKYGRGSHNNNNGNQNGSSQGMNGNGQKGTMYISYCHTHGFSRDKKHTSKTFFRREEGHKEEATMATTMGVACVAMKSSLREKEEQLVREI